MSANVLLLAPPSRPEERLPKPVEHFGLRSRWVFQDETRLDARFYAEDAFQAQVLIEESKLPVKPLGELTKEIFAAPISQRYFHREGTPYLTPSQVFAFRPKAEKFVLASKIRNPERWFVKSRWILVSQSGSPGRSTIATERLEKFVISQNLLRVIPNGKSLTGYLYAWITSHFGQALILASPFGQSVKHLLPQHLAYLPVPMLSKDEQRAIHKQIIEAYHLRDEANALLDQAEELLYQELELPPFDESKVPYMGGLRKPKCFSLRASELAERLDASFHIPIAKAAVALMQKGKYPLARLGDVAERIFIPPRFKRIYVNPEHGLPFLQGSHISMMKPYDLKYISLSHTTKLERWIIYREWVLVTCSGSVGRVALTPSAWDRWAASQHILRIVSDAAKAHLGYLAAFLMTPYGQGQLMSKVYGAVVDELTETDTATILIPIPPVELQKRIGGLVVKAFEKKEQANIAEDQALAQLEACIQESEKLVPHP